MPPEQLQTYISGVADLAPPLADVAFVDRVARAGGRLDVPSGTFRIEGVPPRPAACPSALFPLRRVHGHLLRGRLQVPIPVELELMAWSEARSEIGLRSRGRRLLAGSRRSTYFLVGREVVEELVAALEAWPAPTPAAAPRTRAA